MNSYIIELLKDNNTVIIPGLGALSVTDRARGEYMFMSYLKHNDGLLRNHIANVDGISSDEAQEKIDLFVSQSNEKLRAGKEVELSGLGAFYLDKAGDIDFDSKRLGAVEPVKIVEPVEEKIIPVVEEEIEVPMQEPIVEEIIEEAKVEELESTTIADNTIEEPIEEIIEEPKKEHLEPLVSAAPILDESINEEAVNVSPKEVYTEEQQWEDDLDVPPIDAKIERPKKPIIEKAKFDKKKKGVGKTILIAALAILVVGAVPTFIYFDDIKAKLFGPKEGITELAAEKQFEFEESGKEDTDHYVEQVDNEPTDSIAVAEAEKTVEEVQEPIAPPVDQNTQMESNMGDNGSFKLIVGSFQNQEYANNFEKKMRAEGNTNASVFGPINGFYMVSLGSYPSEQEAKSALASKIGNYPKIWIYKGN